MLSERFSPFCSSLILPPHSIKVICVILSSAKEERSVSCSRSGSKSLACSSVLQLLGAVTQCFVLKHTFSWGLVPVCSSSWNMFLDALGCLLRIFLLRALMLYKEYLMNLEVTSSPTVLLIKSFLLHLKEGKFLPSSSPNEPSTFFCQHFIIFLGFFFFF